MLFCIVKKHPTILNNRHNYLIIPSPTKDILESKYKKLNINCSCKDTLKVIQFKFHKQQCFALSL